MSDNTTGTYLYFGTANAYEHDGELDPGSTYYYALWGISGSEYSANATSAAATTLAFAIETEDMETPTMFAGWFDPPDYTGLSNLEPLYGAINGVADSFGTPRNTAWQGLFLALTAIVSIALMLSRGGFMSGFVVGTILLVFGAGIHILPSWMVLMALIFGIGGWALNRRGVSTE